MVQLSFDLRGLFALGRRRRLPERDVDLGYLLHCQLKELFGDDAPVPFSVRDTHGKDLTVLAYTTREKEELVRHAASFAEPSAHATCDLDRMTEKRMPAKWPAGTKLGFEVRACPIVRVSKDNPHFRAGSEVDAFLAWINRAEQPASREEVYRSWLASELERHGGARLLQFRLKGFQRQRLIRRDHDPARTAHAKERPDALFAGDLEVTDSARFGALLARGIGRHRAFGFGMLLLRPPSGG